MFQVCVLRKMVVHNWDAAKEFFVVSNVGISTIRCHIPDDCVLYEKW